MTYILKITYLLEMTYILKMTYLLNESMYENCITYALHSSSVLSSIPTINTKLN